MAQGFPESNVARYHNFGAPNRFPHAHHYGLPRTRSLRRRRYTPKPRVSPPEADATLGYGPPNIHLRRRRYTRNHHIPDTLTFRDSGTSWRCKTAQEQALVHCQLQVAALGRPTTRPDRAVRAAAGCSVRCRETVCRVSSGHRSRRGLRCCHETPWRSWDRRYSRSP